MDRGRDRRLATAAIVYHMDLGDWPDGDSKKLRQFLNDETEWEHTFYARNNREYCTWSHKAPYFHICACRKRYSGRSFLQSTKCLKKKKLRDKYCMKCEISSQLVVEAIIQTRMSSHINSVETVSHAARSSPTLIPIEAHKLTSDEERPQNDTRGISIKVDQPTAIPSPGQPLVSNNAFNGVAFIAANTAGDVGLQGSENLEIHVDWSCQIPKPSNIAQPMPSNGTSTGKQQPSQTSDISDLSVEEMKIAEHVETDKKLSAARARLEAEIKATMDLTTPSSEIGAWSLVSIFSALPAIENHQEPSLHYSRGQTTNLRKCGPERGRKKLHLTNDVLTNEISRMDIRGDGEVTRLGAGESYRPNHNRRSPPRADTFRSDRDRDRSPRRDRRTPPLSSDSYHPGGRDRSPRRRSRTPPYRARERSPPRDMNWRGRQTRSPLRGGRTPLRARSPRRFSPRRDDDRRERARSPRRDDRRRSRSPFDRNRTPLRNRSPIIRARSPLPRRSPPRRSPPPGPRGSWRPRSRSRDPRDMRTPIGLSSLTWRRRSPSPIRRRSPSPIRRRSPSPILRDSERSSGRSSGTNSRRSSPPVHPSRQALTQVATREAIRSPIHLRDRSPLGPTHRQREQESARSTPKDRSPIRPTAPRSPPRGPAAATFRGSETSFRSSETTFRAPTGPSSGRTFSAPVPSGPSSYNSRSGTESNGSIAPPSGPRGYAPSRGISSSFRGGRSSFSTDRHSRPDTSSWGAAPPARLSMEVSSRITLPPPRPPPSVSPSPARDTAPAAPTGPTGIPTGPRAGTTIPSRPSLQHSSNIYHSRGSISGPSSGPRIHPAMVGIPPIIPGGRIDPTVSGISTDLATRLKKKEEEAEVLREELKHKQEKLRKGLKHWDRLSRESASMGLKSELSESHLRVLAGEGMGGKAF